MTRKPALKKSFTNYFFIKFIVFKVSELDKILPKIEFIEMDLIILQSFYISEGPLQLMKHDFRTAHVDGP